MTIECLGAIQWDHPGIVGPIAAALTAGVFAIVTAIMKRKKPSDDGAAGVSTTVSPEINVAPQIDIDNKPSNVFEPTVNVGLDERGVGKELGKALRPVHDELSCIKEDVKALRSQQDVVQLAPKHTPPDSDDPLKVKAAEFFNAGVEAYGQGEIGQAIGHYRDALALDPGHAYAHNALGVALAAKGELDASIEQYHAALRSEPDDADVHNNLGAALAAKGDLDAAIEHYKEALRIDPDNVAAHNNLGTALSHKGELDAAIEHYNAAIRINPKSARYHDNLGGALAQKGEAAASVAALARAIELDQRYRDWAKTDKDYDTIRDDPAFRKLVYGE